MSEARPAELKLTVIQRSLADAVSLLQRGDFKDTPETDNAARGMAAELKALRRRYEVLYLATTIGAFLLLGPLTGSDFTIFGVHIPASALSKPTVAVLLAGLYQQFLAAIISYTLLYVTFRGLFIRVSEDGWEYLAARYNAEMLWMILIRSRTGGYIAPNAERRLSLIVHIPNYALVLGQVILVIWAIWGTLNGAISGGNLVGICLSVLALFGVIGAVCAMMSALLIKLRYTPAK